MQAFTHTYRLTMAYMGTRFAGWQRQPGQETVQGQVEGALSTLLDTAVGITGASRTDAGVHARGQVAHFKIPRKLDVLCLRRSLNSLLPEEIWVPSLTRAWPGFHARHNARQKTYQYLLHVGEKPSPFQAAWVARMPGATPDVDRMKQAAHCLEGRHDFHAFCGAGSAVTSHERLLHELCVTRRGSLICFRMTGSGFLRHQVRNMVGTLVQVGRSQRAVDSLTDLLESGDRRQAGPTSPASGLCLMSVQYSRSRRNRRQGEKE